MKKWIRRIIITLLALVVIIFVVANLFLGPIVKKTVTEFGPGALGVPVSLEDADIYPLMGKVSLKGLKVGNPEGFETPSAFELGALKVDFNLFSLFTDTIHIREIRVTGPVITYEQELTGNNLGAIQKGLKKEAADEEPAPEAEPEAVPEEEGAGKKVVIDRFLLEEGKLKISLPAMVGAAVPVPLPQIEMLDIGKADEGGESGASVIDVIQTIFSEIFKSVLSVVKGSADLLGKGVKAVGGTALEGAKVAGHAAGAVGGAAVDGTKAVGGAAADGVIAVGGAAAGGAKAVGGAAADGVKAVGGAVGKLGGLLGGGDDSDEKPAETGTAE